MLVAEQTGKEREREWGESERWRVMLPGWKGEVKREVQMLETVEIEHRERRKAERYLGEYHRERGAVR